jgi:hypothetical protein
MTLHDADMPNYRMRARARAHTWGYVGIAASCSVTASWGWSSPALVQPDQGRELAPSRIVQSLDREGTHRG